MICPGERDVAGLLGQPGLFVYTHRKTRAMGGFFCVNRVCGPPERGPHKAKPYCDKRKFYKAQGGLPGTNVVVTR